MNIDVFCPSINYMTWIVVAFFKTMSECKIYYYVFKIIMYVYLFYLRIKIMSNLIGWIFGILCL
jgi:hypothetical protein